MERTSPTNINIDTISTDNLQELCCKIDAATPKSVGYVNIDYKTDKRMILVGMGDWHIGSKFVQYEKWESDLDFISKTPNVFVVLLGDYIDGFGKRSVGGGLYDQYMTVPEARKLVVAGLEKIKHKVIGIVDGCHDLWRKRIDGEIYANELASIIDKSVWLGNEGFINITNGSTTYKVLCRHKYDRYSSLNICYGLRDYYLRRGEFDIAFGAHRHTPEIDISYIKGKKVYTIRCGSYKITDGFLASKSYPPALPIMPCVILDNEKKEILPFTDVKEAIKYL